MKVLFNLDIHNYDENDLVIKRPSARGIIFKDTLVALVYSNQYHYYKFPGGGVNVGESYLEALKREIQEETGILINDDIEPYGLVKRRQASNQGIFEQDNFYYFCNIKKEGCRRNLDHYEDEEGFELRFVDPLEAIRVNKACLDVNDFYKVMIERDTRILERFVDMEEIPNIAFANFLLQESVKLNPGNWLEHSQNVAKAAKMIAHECDDLDEDKAYVLGLLHDIGRRAGICHMKHVIAGYEYMHELGYQAVEKVCITHSYNLQSMEGEIGKRDVSDGEYVKIQELLNEYEYDDYDRLICLADSIAMHTGIVDIIERMSDVKRRYGVYPESKWNQNLYLKSYFEKKMNKTLEELFQI